MKVIRKERSLNPFMEAIILEATYDEDTIFGSFFCNKKFFVKNGERIRLRVPKSKCYEVGDEVPIRKLITMENEGKFSWQWHYKED